MQTMTSCPCSVAIAIIQQHPSSSVAVQHPSSSPTMKSIPTTTNSSSQLLLTQAHDFASQTFHSHVSSVLQHATLTALHRLLSQRLRQYMQHSITHEQLSNNEISVEELLCRDNDELPDLLTLSEEDIQYCYTLTSRLGMKWAQVLQRQEYTELAELTLSIVQRGNYLEPSSATASSSTPTDGNNVAADADVTHCQSSQARSDFVSPYTALHALRRYPNDFNTSGLPSQYLPAIDSDDDNTDGVRMQKQHPGGGDAAKSAVKSMSKSSSSSSARKVIQQIDTMVANGMTYWHYGWDAIEEAVLRNRERIDYSKTGGHGIITASASTTTSVMAMTAMGNKEEEEDEDGEVVLLHPNEVDGEEGLVDRREGVDGNGVESNANEVLNGSRVYKTSRKRGRSVEASAATNNGCNGHDEVEENEVHNDNDEDDNISNQTYCKRGRPPSSIGTELYHRDDILNELTLNERKQLIESSIHPPFPYESDMQCSMSVDDDVMNGNDDGEIPVDEHAALHPHHHAVICGALKDIGQIHLWEQTRHVSGKVPLDGSDSTMNKEEMTNPTQINGETRGVLFGATEAQSLFQSQQQHQLQKRALERAIKERLGRRIVSNAEHRAEYTQHATCSKVRWTEDLEGNDERNRQLMEQSDALHKWLEMDLGECMIEVVNTEQTTLDGVERTDDEMKKKCLLGFRSLEIALRM
jgi:hypothetical protein